MSSADLVPADDMTVLAELDPVSREVAVTRMLGEARSWLAHAVEATDARNVADFKAFVATIAESTKQLNMSKGIQLDALEMVRRAQRGVDIAISRGQEAGEIATKSSSAQERRIREKEETADSSFFLPKATDFVPDSELYGNHAGIRGLGDVSDEVFDAAIEEAKAEANLSQANVVRKTRRLAGADRGSRKEKAERITELAVLGNGAEQIGAEIRIRAATVREIAREYQIDIPADKVTGNARRIDSNRVVEETVIALEGQAMSVALINFAELDPERRPQWSRSLRKSLNTIRKLQKELDQS